MSKIIGGCSDFVNEKTTLQKNGEEMGKLLGIDAILDRTPKCHPEIAGEGVEYSWAQSKIYISNVLWKAQKSVMRFHKFVRLATSQSEGAILTREQIRKKSAWAHDYIVTYFILSKDSNTLNRTYSRISKVDIDKMRKVYRSH